MRINITLLLWFLLLVLSSAGIWCPAPDIKTPESDIKMRIGDI
jgi:hypothetical protein